MARRERRHSFDLSYCQNNEFSNQECNSNRYEQEKERRVHFDDEYLTSARKQHRNRDDIREMNVYETTSKLKESYHNIDKGLEILRRIYDNLMQSKQCLRYRSEGSRKEYLDEINSLLDQVARLEKSLKKSGSQKRHYLDELSKLQAALREDRLKIEAARESRHELHAKMNASTKVTRDHQITINKLKRDNQHLWQILQEVKKHLIEEEKNMEVEECSGLKTYNGGEKENCLEQSEKRKCSHLPELPREKLGYDLYPLQDNQSDNTSTVSIASSQDSILSGRLKYLIDRSENIQNMITRNNSKKSKLNRSFSDNCLSQSSQEEKRGKWSSSHAREDVKQTSSYIDEGRIPSENENGERCDAKDIIRRCEELERRVDQCSTKDLRNRLLQQLKEFDQKESCKEQMQTDIIEGPCGGEEHNHPCTHHAKQPTCNAAHYHHSEGDQGGEQWHPEIHKRVRGELFKCLDQMSIMEKNFSDAQAEISRLRHYIKETSEQKEFHEKTFKREAMQLRMVVDEKVKEVEVLKQNLNDAIKGLKDSEELIIRIDELERIVENRESELECVKTQQQSTFVEMQERLEEKTSELESMRMEMKSALEVMERLSTSNSQKTKSSLEVSLSTEISMLQAAVYDVEEQMNLFKADSVNVRQQLDEKLRMLSEVTAENEELIHRLHGCETEIQALRSNIQIVDSSHAINSYYRQDERVKQLESELTKTLSEKESLLNSTRSSYVKIDKASEEQGQVIETLIDDNEKHLETISQKDRIIQELRDEVRKFTETKVETGFSDNTETKRLLDIIQKRNKTIDELHEQLAAVSTETDKRLVNDLINALSSQKDENSDGKRNIQDELKKIKNILSYSHKDLVDKIITLEEGLGDLKEENKSLRKQMTKHSNTIVTNNGEMDEKFHKMVEENATLRDSLNRPYPDLVQNILLQNDELKRLHEENELLRLGLTENKKELVESNLRKRQRIKDLQAKLDEYEGKDDSKELRKHVTHLSSSRDDVTDAKTSELMQEIKMLNSMVGELEKQNINDAARAREQSKEIKNLKEECERLGTVENANKALEFEVKNLRETLKDIGKESDKLKTSLGEDEGFTPTSPNREFAEKGDLHRMARIADRERKRAEELSMKVDTLRDDNLKKYFGRIRRRIFA